MKIEKNKIYTVDCLRGLKSLSDDSIDLIITSPPYNLGNTHHTGFKKHQAYSDNLPEEDYQNWQVEILQECFRVLKSEGSMMYQHKNRIKNGVQISPYEWIFKTDFKIKQEIVWINRSQNFDKIPPLFPPLPPCGDSMDYWFSRGHVHFFQTTVSPTGSAVELLGFDRCRPRG